MAYANTNENKNVSQLNSFLRGEMSAVETYRIALEKLDADSTSRNQLEQCRASHQRRVDALISKIRALGGVPSEGAGAWGAMTKAIEGAAAALSDDLAIRTLEQGEDHGLADYKADLDKLDVDARSLVTTQLLPQQEETHRTMSTLKRTLARS